MLTVPCGKDGAREGGVGYFARVQNNLLGDSVVEQAPGEKAPLGSMTEKSAAGEGTRVCGVSAGNMELVRLDKGKRRKPALPKAEPLTSEVFTAYPHRSVSPTPSLPRQR